MQGHDTQECACRGDGVQRYGASGGLNMIKGETRYRVRSWTWISTALLVFVPVDAQASVSCHPAPRDLMYACANPTLEASISALGIAYEVSLESGSATPIARRRLRAGHMAWIRRMGVCGTDEACLADATNQRQRDINETRLGRAAASDSQPGAAGASTPVRPASMPMRSMPSGQEDRYEAPPRMYEEAVPRTDWPEPPMAAAETMVQMIPTAQGQTGSQASLPQDATRSLEGPETSYGRMLVGMAISASLPTLAALLMRRRGTMRSPGPRCPECEGTHIRTHAIPTGTKTYVRRMGRGNRMSEIQVERIVRTCPCGYSSEGSVDGSRLEDVLVLRMDQRLNG